jgi:2-polyprenyl-6-methoxyphenol hydroxylase-like FAD-dependent oxidoreductase
MPRGSSGHVGFIGDAAHATSPHLGQGVNLALIDTATLAAAIEQRSSVTDALADYTDRRRKQLRYYSTVTGLMTPFFQSDGRLRGWARDIGLPLLPSIPPIRRLMLKTLRGEAYLPPITDWDLENNKPQITQISQIEDDGL